ncbi:hypothetical protein EXIGLDRAFT_725596 [Exidia glandulosa HHB12029]|uniref:Coenzyme Q-binding protein COQ10 START domain-containing protein n=1 Tax=Exidia glandulosa HHB12029 TaxID=1314781 RepID=A0A165DYK2_EXIGL|nr:hypothetical protein EXIGLDRAFT_725596 [Exidia glandulosa HHB12029]
MRVLAFVLAVTATALAQSNLPPLPDGVFTASARIEIAAPLELVWDIVLDFGSYPDWNPFVRTATVTDVWGVPAAEQRAVEGAFANFIVEIPPLPLPVNASTPLNLLQTQFSRESIVAVDNTLHRAAWKQIMLPDSAVNATRWSAVSTLENGNTLYESAEPYNGLLAPLLQSLFGDGLQQAFEAQAEGLKLRAEAMAA